MPLNGPDKASLIQKSTRHVLCDLVPDGQVLDVLIARENSGAPKSPLLISKKKTERQLPAAASHEFNNDESMTALLDQWNDALDGPLGLLGRSGGSVRPSRAGTSFLRPWLSLSSTVL